MCVCVSKSHWRSLSKSHHRYAWHGPEIQSCSHNRLWGGCWCKDYTAHCQLTGSVKTQLQLHDIAPLPERDSACLGPQQLLVHIGTGVCHVGLLIFSWCLFQDHQLWRNNSICRATFGNWYKLLGNINRVTSSLEQILCVADSCSAHQEITHLFVP